MYCCHNDFHCCYFLFLYRFLESFCCSFDRLHRDSAICGHLTIRRQGEDEEGRSGFSKSLTSTDGCHSTYTFSDCD